MGTTAGPTVAAVAPAEVEEATLLAGLDSVVVDVVDLALPEAVDEEEAEAFLVLSVGLAAQSV